MGWNPVLWEGTVCKFEDVNQKAVLRSYQWDQGCEVTPAELKEAVGPHTCHILNDVIHPLSPWWREEREREREREREDDRICFIIQRQFWSPLWFTQIIWYKSRIAYQISIPLPMLQTHKGRECMLHYMHSNQIAGTQTFLPDGGEMRMVYLVNTFASCQDLSQYGSQE